MGKNARRTVSPCQEYNAWHVSDVDSVEVSKDYLGAQGSAGWMSGPDGMAIIPWYASLRASS